LEIVNDENIFVILKLLGKTKTISSQLLIEIGWQSKITNTSFVAAFVEEQMFAKKIL